MDTNPIARKPAARVSISLKALAAAVVVGVTAAAAWTASADRSTEAPLPMAVSTAVVNVEAVINGSAELRAFNDRLAADVAQMQVELDGYADDLESIQLDFEDLAATDREGRRTLRKRQFEVSARAEVRKRILQNDIDVRKGEAVKTVYEKMLQAIQTISERDGIDVALFDDRAIRIPDGAVENTVNGLIQARRVLYASEGADITQRVLTLMNENYAAGR